MESLFIEELKNNLVKNGYGDFELEEINESYNNKVFSYGDFVIKTNIVKKNLLLEYNLLQSICLKVNSPKSIFFGSFVYDKKTHYFLILQKLNGRHVGYERKGLKTQEKDILISEIVNNLKMINNFIYSDFHFSKKKYSLDKEIIKNYYKIQKNPFINKNNIEKLYNDFNLLKDKIFADEKFFLVHNDLWYKNILVYNGKLSGIIDFETAIFAPKEFELFRILHHRISAKNYIDNGGIDYTELEFIDLLLKEISKNYKEILNSKFFIEKLYLYNINSYFNMMTKYKKKWYKQQNVEDFGRKICSLEECKLFLDEFLNYGAKTSSSERGSSDQK